MYCLHQFLHCPQLHLFLRFTHLHHCLLTRHHLHNFIFYYLFLHSMLALALHRHLHFTHLLHIFHYRHHQLHFLLLHHSLLSSTTIVPISVIVSIILIISPCPCLHQFLHLLIFPTIFIFLFFSMFSVSSSSTLSSDQAALSLSSSLPLFSMPALGTVFNISFIVLSSPPPSLCST